MELLLGHGILLYPERLLPERGLGLCVTFAGLRTSLNPQKISSTTSTEDRRRQTVKL